MSRVVLSLSVLLLLLVVGYLEAFQPSGVVRGRSVSSMPFPSGHRVGGVAAVVALASSKETAGGWRRRHGRTG